MWDAVKAALRGNFIAVSAYFRRIKADVQSSTHTDDFCSHLTKPGEEDKRDPQ